MINLLEGSVYFGVFLGIASYWLGMFLQKNSKAPSLIPCSSQALLSSDSYSLQAITTKK